MLAPDSFRSIIELWPSPSADSMALEIGAGIPAVRKWYQRDRIPAEWWLAVLASEPAKYAGVTAETLAALAAREAAL
jgi:hypothetical protein